MNRFVLRRLTWLEARATEHERAGEYVKACGMREELEAQVEEHLGRYSVWGAQNLLILGDDYRALGSHGEAESSYLRSVDSFSELATVGASQISGPRSADRALELTRALNILGVFYCEQDRPQDALGLFTQALEVSPAAGLRGSPLAILHNNFGSALHTLGHLERAREHYDQALGIFDMGPETVEQAHCLCDLAELLADIDDPCAAPKVDEALSLFHRVGDDNNPVDFLLRIAGLRTRLGDTIQAITQLEDIAQRLECPPEGPRPPERQYQLEACLDLLRSLTRSKDRGPQQSFEHRVLENHQTQGGHSPRGQEEHER